MTDGSADRPFCGQAIFDDGVSSDTVWQPTTLTYSAPNYNWVYPDEAADDIAWAGDREYKLEIRAMDDARLEDDSSGNIGNRQQYPYAERFFIVDARSGEVTRHALTTEAYRDEQYQQFLAEAGFKDVRMFPSLVGTEVKEETHAANLAILARK